MVLYEYDVQPDTVISPGLVLAFGTGTFFFSAMDVLMDCFITWVRSWAPRAKEDATVQGIPQIRLF